MKIKLLVVDDEDVLQRMLSTHFRLLDYEVATAANEMWLVIAAALVMLMQAGFALVEAGFTRAKNAGNIMMKNVMDFGMGGLMYWAIGFGLATQ